MRLAQRFAAAAAAHADYSEHYERQCRGGLPWRFVIPHAEETAAIAYGGRAAVAAALAATITGSDNG